MKTCFSEGKLMKQFGKQFGNPLLSKRTPLSTNPLFLSNFFMTPLFVQISQTRTPPHNFRGEETMITSGRNKMARLTLYKKKTFFIGIRFLLL